jgi:hypothetical protein
MTSYIELTGRSSLTDVESKRPRSSSRREVKREDVDKSTKCLNLDRQTAEPVCALWLGPES